jgi:hypothetical protein
MVSRLTYVSGKCPTAKTFNKEVLPEAPSPTITSLRRIYIASVKVPRSSQLRQKGVLTALGLPGAPLGICEDMLSDHLAFIDSLARF